VINSNLRRIAVFSGRSESDGKLNSIAENRAGVEVPSPEFAQVSLRLGQPISSRAFAQAIFVFSILSANSSWKALVICSGGPDSMISRSGNPWLSNYLKLRGLDKLT